VDGLGIVAKPADAPYRKGRASSWLKIKTPYGRHTDAERAKWNERRMVPFRIITGGDMAVGFRRALKDA